MKYLYFISLFIITNMKSYSTFIRDSFNFNNFITKFNMMLIYRYTDISDNLSILYSLC